MNGFELLQKLRSLDVPQAKTIPVIAITARNDMDEADFQAKGFAGCLHKPFNQDELLRIFKTHTSANWEKYRHRKSISPHPYQQTMRITFHR